MRERYKMTELGEIPAEWEVKKLEVISDIIDSLHETPQYETQGFSMIRVNDINGKGIDTSHASKVSEDTYIKFTRKYAPRTNDIIMSRVGSYGLTSYIKDDEKVCLGQNLVVIVPKTNKSFLFYFLNSDYVKEQIEIVTVGSSQKSLSLANIKKLSIIVPSMEEQQKIADILSTVDEQIENTDSLIEKTKELKKGLMQRLLTKGIGHTEFKETEVGVIPKEWEVTKMGKVSTFINGRAYKRTEFRQEGTPIIRIQNLTGEGEYVYSDLALEEDKYIVNGDLIYAWSATFGPYIWKGDRGIYHYHIWKILCNDKLIDKKFFYYRLHYISSEMDSKKNGSAFSHITKEFMENHIIAVPKLEEQIKIASILSSIDDQITNYQTQKTNLQTLKQALMQQLLTGKIRVRISDK